MNLIESLLIVTTVAIVAAVYFITKYEQAVSVYNHDLSSLKQDAYEAELKLKARNIQLSTDLADITQSFDSAVGANVKLIHEQRIYVAGLEEIKKENTRHAMSGFVYLEDVKSVTQIVDKIYEDVRSLGRE